MNENENVPFDSIPQLHTGSFLTKEQAEQFKEAFKNLTVVIRCKDCKNGSMDSVSYPQFWCSAHTEYHEGEYFCADGERKG